MLCCCGTAFHRALLRPSLIFYQGVRFQKQVVILFTRIHPETSGGRLAFRRQQQMGLVPVEN